MELGPFGIRVNAVCPGSVEGERIDRVIESESAARGISAEALRAEWQELMSMRAFATADDVASMVLFLCSDAARIVSGQAVAVDGNTESK
jgi:NAD(P)-dependent dehydrogenase (short-subunit alcohol dehydrogenase family)